MGTIAHLWVDADDADDAASDAIAYLLHLEGLWSRFEPGSDISALNHAQGAAQRVSEETVTLVDLARSGFAATRGAFDPTILGDLERAGYDRTFPAMTAASVAAATSGLQRGMQHVVLDPTRASVQLPEGVGFDAGGIGKGLAADLAVERLLSLGARGVCVNIGGDARASGVPPTAKRWSFAIASPFNGEQLTAAEFTDGAIATSSTVVRRWHSNEQTRHHLIDPRSGRPVDNDIVMATVVAARGWQVEVLTKAIFVAGTDRGLRLVEDVGAEAFVILRDGTTVETTGWHQLQRVES
jgi:thiamine biosynthesis lipoprotein